MREIALTIAAGLSALATVFTGSTPEAEIDAGAIRARACGYAAYAALLPSVQEEQPEPVVPEKPSPAGKSRQSAEVSPTISDVAIDLLVLAHKEPSLAPIESKPPEELKPEAKPEKSVVVEKPKQTATVAYKTEYRRVWVQTGWRRGHYETRAYRVPVASAGDGGSHAGASHAPAPVFYYWPSGGYSSCANGRCR